MRRIATAVEIDAPAVAVWRVLTDFAAYLEWNAFTAASRANRASARVP